MLKRILKGITVSALSASLMFSNIQAQDEPVPNAPVRLEERLKSEVANPGIACEKYAVLICGKKEGRFSENLFIANQTLLSRGFPERNIYILDYVGEKSEQYPVDDVASKQAIKMIFDHLAKKVDDNDILFVYTTDHGYKQKIGDKAFSTLDLVGEDLLETEFEDYVKPIDYGIGFFLFDQCYGGGFAKRIGKGKNIAMSVADPDKFAFGNLFSQSFFKSWNNPYISDFNEDGRVSVGEAFCYAVISDLFTLYGANNPKIYADMYVIDEFL